MCVNIITIVQHAEEDPIECIVRDLTEAGVDFICFPGAYDRESQRQKEMNSDAGAASVHRFQLRVSNPPSNQLKALATLSKLQISFAEEAIASSKRLVAIIAVSTN